MEFIFKKCNNTILSKNLLKQGSYLVIMSWSVNERTNITRQMSASFHKFVV